MLNNFYENRHLYKDIIDVDVNDSIVADLLDLKSTDSFPIAAKLFQANMISEEFGENLEELKDTFSTVEDHYYHFKTIPTIFEDYKVISSWDKPMSEEEHKAYLEKIRVLENELADKKRELAENQREIIENKRKLAENERKILFSQTQSGEQRVGRNEPCPCGSGKKYKKCCGN